MLGWCRQHLQHTGRQRKGIVLFLFLLLDKTGVNYTSHLWPPVIKLIDTNRKLNFYASFRKDARKNDCLDMINNPHHRIAINKFQLENHKLCIETGRHTIPKTPINLRFCSFCHSSEVENEIHFLVSYMIVYV